MGLVFTLFFSVTFSTYVFMTLSIFFSTLLYFYPFNEYTNEQDLDLLMFG